ncbi:MULTISPECIES: aminomethyl-transferring glycine dehydrogenase subunit GcvPB [Pseudothermotoga]|jgi:glycine dehydrogenase subunit 2|uniref:Probable glycine dehydrogenase (decarboxylating) subunit 2 n=1 Tax=Pseudothermotoga lettingae (strain ATCC BAA-301 / DSM 14385 / NBRC 107922 / TMO) TaxID=416591 RepID=GCSPB_PSELT|nr:MULTISPECIES: aminomethyl-transferring glycine dehydrogenase subunit GcvPB [Pseudothermotoga]A8F8M6.1 RecName: Full=Probable glycine dehydrogenase (decarboxylating) subunit 2; AltName: Full=Glycine cleavage system P-protein subunit 2; AltName: Full=Glycine decarboxylase subunit 2; AltName: Full=Glycine dehydrogenase (aminomethyl-transferring) subunit 2 [Pseudothermotoga lettingae TMO]ABV34510.1 Glycine dehydrogenase (decarboxylating) [Pseudothermotoga lettingae TMO]KUK21210.1 MAG: putative gl
MIIFEKSVPGRKAYRLPDEELQRIDPVFPEHLKRTRPLRLPELSEPDVVRHYTALAEKNYSVDKGFYPLGSCTMKYNPKLNEYVAGLEGFTDIHPYQPWESVQGALQVMYELKEFLCEITGMDEMTLQPAAGAHGELTGMLIVRAYHLSRNDKKRHVALVPDSAHGTNPASAAMAGFDVVEIKSTEDGLVDLEQLENHLNDEIAVLMLTNPNTLGLFEKDIVKIAEKVHQAGALLYYDGANLNAIMGKIKPGEMGFDIVHLNLHKTFSAPHGMGGPGSGPVGVKAFLSEFLPIPIIRKDGDKYYPDFKLPNSIGRTRSFYGNFLVLLKAYVYILSMGKDGLTRASEMAVLNANYLRSLISKFLKIASPGICMHEFVVDGSQFVKETGVKILDVAKRILDYGLHAPTVYFPLIVHEDMMIEPTETENKNTLDYFAKVLEKIVEEAKKTPEVVKTAPHTTPVKRLDDITATKKPVYRYRLS